MTIAILAKVAILGLVWTAWGQGTPSNKHGNWEDCDGVKSGLEVPKRHDGVLPLNEPCYGTHGNHCNGYMVCCVTRGTCMESEINGVAISSSRKYYEGGCQSLQSRKTEWDDEAEGCTQQGECMVGYLATMHNDEDDSNYPPKDGKYTPGIHAEEGYFTRLPDATMARLMNGSNYDIARQGCGNFIDWDQCSEVQSGINLAKPTDGREPVNEPCYGHNGHCKGYPVCCVTRGTCLTNHSGSAISSNKAYYEGGCQSKESSNTEWDEGCTQQGECHIAYIRAAGGGITVAGHLTMPPDDVMDRLMVGSNWDTNNKFCVDATTTTTTTTTRDVWLKSPTPAPATTVSQRDISAGDKMACHVTVSIVGVALWRSMP